MPATALTKVTAASFGDGVADVGWQNADATNKNSFVNTGKTLLLVTRTGGTVQPTFDIGASKYTVNDAITKTPSGPVGDGDVGIYGPFPTAIYGATVTVDYDTDTDVDVAVVELEDTPL